MNLFEVKNIFGRTYLHIQIFTRYAFQIVLIIFPCQTFLVLVCFNNPKILNYFKKDFLDTS